MGASSAPVRRPKLQHSPATRLIYLPRRPCARRKSSKAVSSKTTPHVEDRVNLEALFDRERSFNGVADAALAVFAEAEEAKEAAMKKVGKRREKIDRNLKSAAQNLLSERERISKGQSASCDLDKEIDYLVDKLQKLNTKSRGKDHLIKNYRNFSENSYMAEESLQTNFHKSHIMPSEILQRNIKDMAEASLSIDPNHQKEMNLWKEKMCSGHCQAIVRNLVEQARVETEQWSQMQEMLGRVKDEMDDLQISRDYWEERARISDERIHSLSSSVQEWKRKAVFSEQKVKDLQSQVSNLKESIKYWKDLKLSSEPSTEQNTDTILGILVRRLKENPKIGLEQTDPSNKGRRRRHSEFSGDPLAPKGKPLRDIGNVSSSVRQKSKSISSLEPFTIDQRTRNYEGKLVNEKTLIWSDRQISS